MALLICLIGVALFVVASALEAGSKNFGLLYLLVLPVAILLVPFKLAAMMMGGKRR